ncbi:LpqB family beta-propeller domain-containing protein [Actinocorallia lasiicapitis]
MNRRLTITLTAVALTGTGCATFPTGGPVDFRADQDRAGSFDDPHVRIIPSSPQDGWSPVKVVEGFLTAMADRDDVKLLESYLVPGAVFDPRSPDVEVIADPTGETPLPDVDMGANEATVTIYGNLTGQITTSGLYTAKDDRTKRYVFTLKQISAGRWRIVSRPPQMVLLSSAVDRSYRTTKLYFYAPDQQVLVPRWVFLPLVSQASRPSKLVDALLNSPLAAQDSVRTAIPNKTSLTEPVQQTDDGTVTVSLSKEAAAGDPQQMAAQIMWTLRQVPGAQNIRLKIDGKAIKTAAGKDGWTTDDFVRVDPDFAGGTTTPYVLTSAGRLAGLDAPESPLPAFQGRSITKPAGSIGVEQLVSAVEGRSVLVSKPGSTTASPVLTVAKDKNLLRPSWDRHGNLWMVARNKDGSGATLHRWSTGMARAVPVPWGLETPLTKVDALRVARDGVRVALLIRNGDRPEIQMAELKELNGAPAMGDFRTINADLSSITDLTWLNADTLAVLGRAEGTGTSVLPFQVPVSGGKVRYIGGSIPGKPMTITASPTKIFIGVRVPKDGETDHEASTVFEQDYSDLQEFGQWTEVQTNGDVTEPVYPG